MAITILALGREISEAKKSPKRKISDFSGIWAFELGNVRGSSLAPRIPPMAIVHADLEFARGSSLLGAGPEVAFDDSPGILLALIPGA
jgi:hypothetical protein